MSHTTKFIDLTLRDGHQSLAATRMTTEQILRVLKMTNDAGYPRLELWGGAVLDSCIRFLNEDPWERLEKFRSVLGGGKKIRALLRGQNLFGYEPSSDDLVISFVKEAVLSGVGVMRIFDALNDERNLITSILTTKAYGGVAEGAISYTTSPVHTTDYFVDYAKKLIDMGVDELAIKDMAGLLYPTDALELFQKLRAATELPITLHSHTTTGVATLNSVIAMNEGIDYVDTAITPFAGGTSHPPIEILAVFAERMGIDHGLDKKLILKIQAELFNIQKELSQHIPDNSKGHKPVKFDDVDVKKVDAIIALVKERTKDAVIKAIPLMRELEMSLGYPEFDDKIFEAQVPGGMLSNLWSQLKQMNKLDQMDKILAEIPVVRKDAGYVPLVTPTSQIVGSQAAFNVMAGERYKMVSNEFKMILQGKFGRTPAPTNPEITARALGKDAVLKYRAASYLKPVMEDDYSSLLFVKSHKDLLLHLLFRQAADTFLKKRYGM
ncbi:MAG: oxaloacetate decarboxylase subunit alpha [Acidobacteriota bacterium]